MYVACSALQRYMFTWKRLYMACSALQRISSLYMACAALQRHQLTCKRVRRSVTASISIQKCVYGVHSVAVQASACIKADLSMRAGRCEREQGSMCVAVQCMREYVRCSAGVSMREGRCERGSRNMRWVLCRIGAGEAQQ